MSLFLPHSAKSVLKELIKGLGDGSIAVQRSTEPKDELNSPMGLVGLMPELIDPMPDVDLTKDPEVAAFLSAGLAAEVNRRRIKFRERLAAEGFPLVSANVDSWFRLLEHQTDELKQMSKKLKDQSSQEVESVVRDFKRQHMGILRHTDALTAELERLLQVQIEAGKTKAH